ncbi:MAG TPA: A/G-specific adenine glycosylase [Candidatus Omnitrophota bacterium]|nr:A/G-specific adenine glycosylase [Candidatus Omnitrophota bacterium]HQO58148.1 A/G-specific adenine glycosylase [Candidatus Omnitrophota bacterium]
MNKNVFRRNLRLWYRRHARDLPWRRTCDPYKIWISEIMLQQTTVSAVIPFYERWLAKFPDIASVARSSSAEVLKAWQGLGYYQRARNIHKAAQIICERHGGLLPVDKDILRSLPGFGAYTTGAVLSIAFQKAETIIDANIRRVFMRLLLLKGTAEDRYDGVIAEELKRLLPVRFPGDFNQALMELGAILCRRQLPLCSQCPVRGTCLAYHKGVQEIIPEPKVKQWEDVRAAVAVIKHKGRFLIQQRPPTGLLAGLWEFPGGRIQAGETSRQALERELKEELGVVIQTAVPLMHVRHFYTRFRVHLSVWLCTTRPSPRRDSDHRWVGLREFADFAMPSGSVKIVEKLCALHAL